jgi:hypothetical protein
MSRKVQIRVDLPHDEYEAAKMAAGNAANVPSLMRKALKESIERWLANLESTSSSTGPTTRQR